jgi:hypothetical protein
VFDHEVVQRVPKDVHYGSVQMTLLLRKRQHFDAPAGHILVQRLLIELQMEGTNLGENLSRLLIVP